MPPPHDDGPADRPADDHHAAHDRHHPHANENDDSDDGDSLLVRPAPVFPAGRRRFYFAFVLLGGSAVGFDLGAVAGALTTLQPAFGLTPMLVGAVVAAVNIGQIPGAILGGHLVDARGRVLSLRAAQALHVIGALVSATAAEVGVLCAGRLVLGMAVGASSSAHISWASDVVPRGSRSSVVATYELALACGVLAAFVAYAVMPATANAWRGMFALGAVPALAQAALMPLVPESPKWLALHRGERDALKALRSIYGSAAEAEAEAALNRAEIASHAAAEVGAGGVLEQARRRWWAPMQMLALALWWNFFCGGINVRTYGPVLLEHTGASDRRVKTLSMLVAVVKLLATLHVVYAADSRPRFVFSFAVPTPHPL